MNRKRFFIKGAGLEFGDIKSLARNGGNAFRTWRVEDGNKSALEILDEAEDSGLLVCMGLDVARERHGFNYDDKEAVAGQLENIRRDVQRLKHHPALLMWGIGNELNLRHKNPRVWDAVNEISEAIHLIDGNHPTTTMLAGADPETIKTVSGRCQDLDLLSFQMYRDIEKLPEFLRQSDYSGAYTVSEWGTTGHWEAPCTAWGRPIEQTSSEKASAIKHRYNNFIITNKNQCVGAFVFLWGQKQERTPTWYGLFLENGRHTEMTQTMYFLWTRKLPKRPLPTRLSMEVLNENGINITILVAGNTYSAHIQFYYQQKYRLAYRWELMEEVDRASESDGGDLELQPAILWTKKIHDINRIIFYAPKPGEYRLFIYIEDPFNGSSTANMPLLVAANGTTLDETTKLESK